jgi:DNA-binding LytR/AlgR family response regulator
MADWLLELDPDDAINRILRALGESSAADRAWLVRYDAAFTHFWNTHEWAAPGVKPFVQELQGIPVAMGAFFHERLEKDEAVRITDVARLPRRARPMQAELNRQGIQSLLAVPVLWQGRLALQIGLDTLTPHPRWTARDEQAVRQAGKLIGLRLFPEREFPPSPVPGPNAPAAHIHDGSSTRAVPAASILWIQSAGDYSAIHVLGGRSAMELRSLNEWERLLPPEQFIRIHRTLIVNAAQIHGLTRADGTWKLSLHGTSALFPVGRKHRALVRQRLGF